MPEFQPENMKAARVACGKSQALLATEISRTISTVHRYEDGARVPSARMLGLIADLLGVQVGTLYDVEPSMATSAPASSV